MIRPALLCLALSLAACGGGGGGGSGGAALPLPLVPAAPAPAPTYTARLLIQPSDAIVQGLPGYTHSMQSNETRDAALSVAEQSQQQYPALVLTIGDTRNRGFEQGDVYLREVIKYPKFTHVYLYDELFWTGTAIEIGRDEQAVNIAARMVRGIGLKTAISLTPATVLHPDFKLIEPGLFDVIAVDVYPSAHGPDPDLLPRSVARLRAIGYTGAIWYAYQAFGPAVPAELARQRETIRTAPSLGVTGLVPFGLYLSRAQLQREPNLFQGVGSDIESQVQP